MPDLKTILQETMLFTAAKGSNIDLFARALDPSFPVTVPEPQPQVTANTRVIKDNPIWHWTHDAARPNVFSRLTCKPRGMGMNYGMAMPVCKQVVFEDIDISPTTRGEKIHLKLDASHLMLKFFLPYGRIPENDSGLWQLETETDASMLLLFGYKIKKGVPEPLSLDEAIGLKHDLMPSKGTSVSAIAEIGETAEARIKSARILVCASLTLCKERADFEPGEVLGAARIYPHVMLMSDVPLFYVNAPILIERPETTISHDPEMTTDISAAIYADGNEDVSLARGRPPALPFWDNFFDYYSVDPIADVGKGELTFVDATTGAREIVGAIQRLEYHPRTTLTTPGGVVIPIPNTDYAPPSSFRKVARQGEFDNIHLAPAMKMAGAARAATPALATTNIIMAPFCVHDCLHTHVRWGMPNGALPKPNKGFAGDVPYQIDGAPLVPANQSVFVTILSRASFRYRALAVAPIPRGAWQVIMHHGCAYACAVDSPFLMDLARDGVGGLSVVRGEPYPALSVTDSYAAFYWRLRYGGNDPIPLERIKILDLDQCRR